MTPKKISYGSPRKWMSNFTKLHLTHEIFRILPVFSLFLWNLTFLFSDSDGKFSLVLLQNFFVFNLLPGFFHYYSYRCFTTVAKKNRMKKEWRKNKIKVNTDTMLLQMTNYIFWALEKWKRMQFSLNYSGTRFLSTEN